MNVTLHIEHIILDGLRVEHGQRRLIQTAVESELAQLIATGGLSPGLSSGIAVPNVPAPDIQLTREDSPAQLGRQIAQAVYTGIGG